MSVSSHACKMLEGVEVEHSLYVLSLCLRNGRITTPINFPPQTSFTFRALHNSVPEPDGDAPTPNPGAGVRICMSDDRGFCPRSTTCPFRRWKLMMIIAHNLVSTTIEIDSCLGPSANLPSKPPRKRSPSEAFVWLPRRVVLIDQAAVMKQPFSEYKSSTAPTSLCAWLQLTLVSLDPLSTWRRQIEAP